MMKKMLCRGLLVCFAFVVMLMQGKEVFAVNDSFTNATSIGVNKAVTDNVISGSDINYYKFTTSSNGKLSIDFTHAELESTSNEWKISLYNSSKETIMSMYSKGHITSTLSSNYGLPAGSYYVTVAPVSYYYPETVNYQLKVNYVVASNWETEFNDSFLTADGMAVNNGIYGSTSTGSDVDYYKFATSSNGKLSIDFTHAELESTSNEWKISLYNENRECIMSMYSKGYISNTVSTNYGLPAGSYYITVEAVSYYYPEVIDYMIMVNYAEADNWETEFNNGYLTADNILLNKSIYGSTSTGADIDYYEVYVPKEGYIQVEFSHKRLESSDKEWKITLINEKREAINTTYSYGNKSKEILNKIYLKQGTYYIAVEAVSYYYPETCDYVLKVYYTTLNAGIKSATSPSSKKMSLKWKKLQGVTGYEIVTATDKKFKKNKKITTISSKNKTKTTIKQLKKGKKYYVKMRGYITVDGKKYYGSYSKTKKVTIR